MAGDKINTKNLLQIGSRQMYMVTPKASQTIQLRFNLITMSQTTQFQNKYISVAGTFIIIHKGIISGQIYRTRIGADSQEVWLSRDMPPHSLGPPPRFLNLTIQGNLLPRKILKITGIAIDAICGISAVTGVAVCTV